LFESGVDRLLLSASTAAVLRSDCQSYLQRKSMMSFFKDEFSSPVFGILLLHGWALMQEAKSNTGAAAEDRGWTPLHDAASEF
jgi:hypothetical protein